MKGVLIFLSFISFLCTWGASYELRTESDGTQWRPFKQCGYFGVINAKGKIIIPAEFSSVSYENGTFTVKNNVGYLGKYTSNGKVIFPPLNYSMVYEFDGIKDSPYKVVGEKFGIVDRRGKVLLEDEYTRIEARGDSLHGFHLLLWKNGFMGVADMKGNILIVPDRYHSIGRNVGEDGKITFTYRIYGGGSGVCNEKGEEIIHTDYFTTLPKGKGKNRYYEITDGNCVGKLDKDGNLLIPITDKVTSQLTQVESNGKIFTIWRNESNKCFVKNPEGEILIEPEYDDIGFRRNHFTVRKGRYWGLINTDGKMIVSIHDDYFAISTMEKYITARTLDDKQAIYGYDGKMVFPAIHQHAQLHVRKIYEGGDSIILYSDAPGSWGVKNLKGEILVQPIYDGLGFLESDLGFYFKISKNGKVGLQDLAGNIIFEPEYKSISISKDKNNPFFFINTGYMGIADLDGNVIINPEIFEKISFDPKKKQFTGTVGRRKCVFTNDGKLISDNLNQVKQYEYADLADVEFKKGNYKKAAEWYGKAINVTPTASLYFNRGVSYYNANKYYEAIADFKKTLDSRPSDRLRDRAIDLIGKAEHYQEQKEYRQTQLVSAIFGLAMTGINYALQSKSKSRKSTSSSFRTSGGSSYSSSSSSSSGNDNGGTSTKQKQKCGFCGGKGSIVKYQSNFGIDNEPWCDECEKKVVSGHYHQTCTHCNGTGER